MHSMSGNISAMRCAYSKLLDTLATCHAGGRWRSQHRHKSLPATRRPLCFIWVPIISRRQSCVAHHTGANHKSPQSRIMLHTNPLLFLSRTLILLLAFLSIPAIRLPYHADPLLFLSRALIQCTQFEEGQEAMRGWPPYASSASRQCFFRYVANAFSGMPPKPLEACHQSLFRHSPTRTAVEGGMQAECWSP